jgi:hypothetical protein
LNKYRRIEVNAFRRRVTIVSGEWQREAIDVEPALTEDAVSLRDIDSCEPVEPDSPEGQLILVEAVRSLERRLSPEARATIHAGQNTLAGPTNFSLAPDKINDPRPGSQRPDDKLKFVGHSSPKGSKRTGLSLKLQSLFRFIWPKALRFSRKEK